MPTIAETASEISEAWSEWLEDILAGLMSNGVRPNEIEIQHHPGCRTVVMVRGASRYEWNMTVDTGHYSR